MSELQTQLEQAARLGQQGQIAQAKAICEQVLQTEPRHPWALQLYGLTLMQSKDFESALAALQTSFALQASAQTASHLGVCYSQMGDYLQGIAYFQKSLQLEAAPNLATLHNLLLAQQKQGDLNGLARTAQAILKLTPHDATIALKLAQALSWQGLYQDAITYYQKSLEQNPQQAGVWLELGMVWRSQGEIQQALRAYQQCLDLEPNSMQALINMGVILQEQSRFEQAQTYFERAQAIDSDSPLVLINLGNLYASTKQIQAALSQFERLLELEPENLLALDGLVRMKLESCDWNSLEPLTRRLMAAAEGSQDQATAISPYSSLFLPFSAQQQLKVAQAQARRCEQIIARYADRPSFYFAKAQAKSRLKIGYLSADYRQHILGDMIWQLFSWHDRKAFEVYAYATNENDGSEYYQKFRHEADLFRDLSKLSVVHAAQQIYQDQLDILIYLGGYTEGDRTEILALHPAPIQMVYLDYPATMGADWIDYLITDQIVTPPEFAKDFSEHFVYLPGSYQLNNEQLPSEQTCNRAQAGLPEDAFVYACFNKANRISPDLFAIWMNILQAVPESVLWLLAQNALCQEHLRATAREHGVDPDRLIFAPLVPKAQHIARQACADLFLDTFYTNAHTTASDALWAGLPVLTLPGQTFASRVGASLLHAVGLPELIVSSREAYQATAIALSQQPETLAAYKHFLQTQGRQSCLFQSALTVQNLESAYQAVWQRACEGLAPDLIEVPPRPLSPRQAQIPNEYYPRDSQLLQHIAELEQWGQQGRFDEIKARCLGLLTDYPQQAKLLHLCGMAHLMSGQAAQAHGYLLQAHQLCPRQADICQHLGLACSQSGQGAKGIEYLQLACHLKPESIESWYNLGLMQMKAEDLEAALIAFQRLIVLNPGYSLAYLQMGHIYNLQEQWAEAQFHYQLALKYNPNNKAAQTALAELKIRAF